MEKKESRRKDMKKSKKKFIKRFANGKYEKRKCWTSSEEW